MRPIKSFNPRHLAAMTLAVFLVVLLPNSASAQTAEGLSSDASYRYELAEDGRGVDVNIDLAITNVKPNRSTNRGTTQYYFTGYFISIPENATDLVVTQNGSGVEFERLNDDGFDALDIVFRRNIFYRNTADLNITFTLGSGGPRSTLPVRINEAYAGFEVWATPGVDTADITIELPVGFESDRFVAGSSLTTNDDGSRSMVIDGITSEDFFLDYVALRNDDNLTVRPLEVDGIEVEIQHWPNDSAWADFVEDRVLEDLPLLVDAVGLAWPLDEPLVIQESFSPALSGYGGWYDPIEHVIEVGDEFDNQLVIHELSHVWSNAELFASRWITEGIADELAAIVDADGGDIANPDPTSLVDANAIPLLDWTNGFNEPETEVWSYGASWTVTREITDMVGPDGLRSIIVAAESGDFPYLGEGEAETFSTLASWKNYLDWVQELTQDDDVEDLFRDWVVPEWRHGQLDERADARERYVALREAGDGWANPLVIREQMTMWDFEDATISIDDALEVLAERDRALAAAADLDVAMPEAAELAYQDAEVDMAEALALTTELANSAEALVGVHSRFDAERSLFTRVGLIGVDPSDSLTAAVAAFETGEFADMVSAGDDLDDTLSAAEQDGQLRVGLAAIGALGLLCGLGFMIRRRRRNRTLTVPDDLSELDADTPADEADLEHQSA